MYTLSMTEQNEIARLRHKVEVAEKLLERRLKLYEALLQENIELLKCQAEIKDENLMLKKLNYWLSKTPVEKEQIRVKLHAIM